MISLSLILSPFIALQGVGQAPVAVANDAPETWTLEYPRVIQPFVEDYRRCLTRQTRRVTGQADFEQQHRRDVETCTEAFEEAQEGANRMLAGRAEYSDYSPADIREVFEHIGRIHVARGADLDNQFTFTLRSAQLAEEQYQAERPKGLVLELHDASVVKARTDATAAAAEAAQEQRTQAREEASGAQD